MEEVSFCWKNITASAQVGPPFRKKTKVILDNGEWHAKIFLPIISKKKDCLYFHTSGECTILMTSSILSGFWTPSLPLVSPISRSLPSFGQKLAIPLPSPQRRPHMCTSSLSRHCSERLCQQGRAPGCDGSFGCRKEHPHERPQLPKPQRNQCESQHLQLGRCLRISN